MNRRTLLATVATTAVAGCTGNSAAGASATEGEPETLNTVESAPKPVDSARPLMKAFLKEVRTYFPNATVAANEEGEIFLDYVTKKESSDALKTEFHQIAELYVDEVEKTETYRTLSIISGEVMAIVPADTVEAHVNGNLDEEAFHETIGVMSVERNNGDE